MTHSKERFSISASLGHLSEYGSMFGGSRNSPYGVDDAKTYSFGLSGAYRLADDVRLIGNYSFGLSDIDGTNNSLLSDFSSVRSDSWALGVMFDNVARSRDRIGFAVSQPLKITEGFVDFTVPYTIDSNNVVSSNTERVDLGAGGRELALESFYRMWTGKKTRFTTYLMHQRHPSNIAGSTANTVLGIFEYQF